MCVRICVRMKHMQQGIFIFYLNKLYFINNYVQFFLVYVVH